MGGASDRFDECQAFTEWIRPLEHAGIFGVLWGPDPNFLTGSSGERSLIRGLGAEVPLIISPQAGVDQASLQGCAHRAVILAR